MDGPGDEGLGDLLVSLLVCGGGAGGSDGLGYRDDTDVDACVRDLEERG